MEKPITKIKKVEIKGLWNRFDLSWTLNPDVNVLSGINGSGKSTILRSIANFLMLNKIPLPHEPNLIGSLIISFNDEKILDYHYFSPLFLAMTTKKQMDKLKIDDPKIYDKVKKFGFTAVQADTKKTLEALQKQCKFDFINTFDNEMLKIENPLDSSIKTELDKVIFRLQKEYLDFQLNFSKKLYEVIIKNGVDSPNHLEVLKMRQTHERFLEIIDQLFEATGKKINREKNEIMFTYDKEDLTPYQLSSGEKQMLVILLTVLIQDHRNSILFMDEPEISLHFDWQKKLIQYIRELNPNVQIILATHSPAVIMEGWLDKVFEVSDLVTPIKTNTKK